MIRQKSCRPPSPPWRSSANLAHLAGLAGRGGLLLALVGPGPLGPGLLGAVLGGLVAVLGLLVGEALRLLHGLVDAADEVERLLRQVVVATLDYLLERADRLVELHELALLARELLGQDRKSTRLNSSHANTSYAVFCLKKKQ